MRTNVSTMGSPSRATTFALALLVVGCGNDGTDDGAGTGAPGSGGGGSNAGSDSSSTIDAAASSSSGEPAIRPASLIIEQVLDRSTDPPTPYFAAEAWFAAEPGAIEQPRCEGMEAGPCVLVSDCATAPSPPALTEVGRVVLDPAGRAIDLDRQTDGRYFGSRFEELVAPRADVVTSFGVAPDLLELATTSPAGIHVATDTLLAAIRNDRDLVLPIELDGEADAVHVWVGDDAQRIECRFPADEPSVRVPHGLLQNLDASSVLLAAFTQTSGTTTVGSWDVTWRYRNVELAVPIELEDHTEDLSEALDRR